MEDVAAGLRRPCVLDAKLGLRTWYAWADPATLAKCRSKDETTTQSTLGFRLCGLKASRADDDGGGGGGGSKEEWCADRHWGKTLRGASDVDGALERFASNGERE